MNHIFRNKALHPHLWTQLYDEIMGFSNLSLELQPSNRVCPYFLCLLLLLTRKRSSGWVYWGNRINSKINMKIFQGTVFTQEGKKKAWRRGEPGSSVYKKMWWIITLLKTFWVNHPSAAYSKPSVLSSHPSAAYSKSSVLSSWPSKKSGPISCPFTLEHTYKLSCRPLGEQLLSII